MVKILRWVVSAQNSPSRACKSGPPIQEWMRRVLPQPSPRGRPRSLGSERAGQSSRQELAPTPECRAPRDPSVLPGPPGCYRAASLQPGRCGGVGTWLWCAARKAQRLGLPARAAGGAPHRHRPSTGTESASACARPYAPPPPGLSFCGESAAPPAAPAPLLSALLGERAALTWTCAEVAPNPLGQSVNQPDQPCSPGSSGPDGWPGSFRLHPHSAPPRRPRPRFPGHHAAPLRSAGSPLPLLLPPPPFSPARFSLGMSECKRKTRSLVSKFGPWTAPAAGHR